MISGHGPMPSYRILELGGLRTAMGLRFLSAFGAEVIRVEPPEGSDDRHVAPFVDSRAGPDRSLVYLARNGGKRSIVLDLSSEANRPAFNALLQSADAVVVGVPHDVRADWSLDEVEVRRVNPQIIYCSVSDYGLSGPHRDWTSTPITALAASGAMSVAGTSDNPPCDAPTPLAWDVSSIYAALGVQLALMQRKLDSKGRTLDISVQEASMQCLYPWAVPTYSYSGSAPARGGAGSTMFRCARGERVRMLLTSDSKWETLVQMLGDPPELRDPRWLSREERFGSAEELKMLVEPNLQTHDAHEFCAKAREAGILIAVVRSPSELLDDANIVARGFFGETSHPEFGTANVPGVPFKMSTFPAITGHERPPLLGEHTSDVLDSLNIDGGALKSSAGGDTLSPELSR